MSGAAPLLALLAGTSTLAPEASILLGEPFRLERLLPLLPSAGSPETLLESTFHPVILGLEESGGFSRFDPPRVSLWGDSWTTTRWRLLGIDISDPLRPGAPAFRPPPSALAQVSVSSSADADAPGEATVWLEPRRLKGGVSATLRGVAPNVGDIVPFAVPLMNAISGKHIRDRDIPPPVDRRGFGSLFEAEVSAAHALGPFWAELSAEISEGTRQYLDHQAGSTPFLEPVSRASFLALLRSGSADIVLGTEYLSRGNAFAELGLARMETAREETATFFLGAKVGGLRGGISAKTYAWAPQRRAFPRELIDPDGEGLFPYYPDGRAFGLSASFGVDAGIFHLETLGRGLLTHPLTNLWSSALSLDGRAYGLWRFESLPSASFVGASRVGLGDRNRLGPLSLSWTVQAFETHAFNDDGANGIFLADLLLEGELEIEPLPGWALYLTAARTPLPLTMSVAQALDPGYLEARLLLSGKDLIDTRGGASTSVDGGLIASTVLSAALGTRLGLGAHWSLTAQGTVKAYPGALWMSYLGGPEASGSFAADGTYYLSPGAKRYVLGQSPYSPPVYFGAELQVSGIDPERYFVLLSFGAYNLVGHSGFRHGSGGNDIGVISPEMANPNGSINGFANLDGDRAFLTKAALGLRLLDHLWLTATVKHRDGRPFSFYDVRTQGAQAALVLHETRGAPLDYQRPLSGPREDFRLNMDAALRFDAVVGGSAVLISLVSTNLLDLGNEIAELQTAVGRRGRSALESEIGRALFLELSLSEGVW